VCAHSSKHVSALQVCRPLINYDMITSVTCKLHHFHKLGKDTYIREKLYKERGGCFNKSKSSDALGPIC